MFFSESNAWDPVYVVVDSWLTSILSVDFLSARTLTFLGRILIWVFYFEELYLLITYPL